MACSGSSILLLFLFFYFYILYCYSHFQFRIAFCNVSQKIMSSPFPFPPYCTLQKTLHTLLFCNLLLKTSDSQRLHYQNQSLYSLHYRNLTSKLLLFAQSSLEFILEFLAEAMTMRDSLMSLKLKNHSLL